MQALQEMDVQQEDKMQIKSERQEVLGIEYSLLSYLRLCLIVCLFDLVVDACARVLITELLLLLSVSSSLFLLLSVSSNLLLSFSVSSSLLLLLSVSSSLLLLSVSSNFLLLSVSPSLSELLCYIALKPLFEKPTILPLYNFHTLASSLSFVATPDILQSNLLVFIQSSKQRQQT